MSFVMHSLFVITCLSTNCKVNILCRIISNELELHIGHRNELVIYFNSVLCFVFMTEDTWNKDGCYSVRYQLD